MVAFKTVRFSQEKLTVLNSVKDSSHAILSLNLLCTTSSRIHSAKKNTSRAMQKTMNEIKEKGDHLMFLHTRWLPEI